VEQAEEASALGHDPNVRHPLSASALGALVDVARDDRARSDRRPHAESQGKATGQNSAKWHPLKRARVARAYARDRAAAWQRVGRTHASQQLLGYVSKVTYTDLLPQENHNCYALFTTFPQLTDSPKIL
jgi:hypothetical protein